MEKIKIVAILEMSAGNETVGEMWQETKVFDIEDTLFDVLSWAYKKKGTGNQVELFKGNLKLTIGQ